MSYRIPSKNMFECHSIRKGNPSAPCLIFLHGLFGSAQDWLPFLSFFSNHYYCIALDLPGHGETPYREDIIKSFQAELKQTSIHKPLLIGYSLGGRIALQVREETKGIIAISSHVGLKTQEEKKAQLEKEAYWKEQLLTRPLQEVLEKWYAQPLFNSLSLLQKEALIYKRKDQNPQVLAQVITQMSLAHQEYITLFPTPTFFIYGEEDSKYKELYSSLQLPAYPVKNAGHACLVEEPKACRELILNCIEQIRP